MNRPIDIRTRQLKCEVSPRFTSVVMWTVMAVCGVYAASLWIVP